MGYRQHILKDEDEEGDGLTVQTGPRRGGLKLVEDTNLGVFSNNKGDVGLIEGDPLSL